MFQDGVVHFHLSFITPVALQKLGVKLDSKYFWIHKRKCHCVVANKNKRYILYLIVKFIVDFFSCLIKSLHLEQKAAFPDRRSSTTTLTFSQMDLGTYIQEIKGHSDLH